MEQEQIIFAGSGMTHASPDPPHGKKSEREPPNDFSEMNEKGREEGIEEAVKEVAKAEAHTQRILEHISSKRDAILFKARTFILFDLFPDTIIIDTTKVTIIHKIFFATEYITTIPLKNLSDAMVQTAFFLASLKIVYMPQVEMKGTVTVTPIEIQINYLWRHDALRAKNIIKGVMVAHAEKIDIELLNPHEIKDIVERLGENTVNL